jgi:hypothetical protein
MQRNISRRDFGKRLAGGAALLALQSAWNYRAAAQSLRNDLKDLKGELYFDDAEGVSAQRPQRYSSRRRGHAPILDAHPLRPRELIAAYVGPRTGYCHSIEGQLPHRSFGAGPITASNAH